MNTDLVHLISIPEDATERLAIFTKPAGAGVQPFIDKIVEQVESLGMGDASTETGRAEIKSLAFKIVKSKTYLEGIGKSLTDEQKKIPKLIDATRRYSEETLDALAKKVRAPLTEWEQREDDRRAGHETAIGAVAKLVEVMGSSNEIRDALEKARATPVDEETCQEFVEEYVYARDGAVRTLEQKLQTQEKVEADQVELATLRAEREERDAREAKDREAALERQRVEHAARERDEHAAEVARIAEERRLNEAAAAEERRLEAEQRHKAELARVEAERLASEERANRATALAEARQREEADRLRQETERREADQDHRRKINSAAVDALVEGGMSVENARRAVTLIAQRKVPAVSIAY